MNYSFSRKIPSKILILFLSFLVFAGSIYYLTQKTYKGLLISVNELSKPDESANLINELLFDISRSNLIFQSYTISGKSSYLKDYFKYNKTIIETLSKLKRFSKGTQLRNIDTVEALWKQKDAQIQYIMNLAGDDKDQIINPFLLRKGKIITDSITKQVYIYFIPVLDTSNTFRQSSYIPDQQKKGFKQWFRGIFKASKDKNDSSFEGTTSHQNSVYRMESDTVITEHRKVEVKDSSSWWDMVSKYKSIDQSKRKLQKELGDMIQNDAKISEELENMVLNIRSQIYIDSETEKQYARSMVSESLKLMKYVGLAAFGFCFVFVVFIISDVLKGEYYKLSLEKANATIKNNSMQKENFLYSVSHEIRTPLTAILGFAEQIDHMDLKPKGKQYTHIIINAANHLLDTVNEVLDIAKLGSGKFVIHAEEVSLQKFLGGMTDLFRMDAEEKGIAFKVDMSGVKADYIITDPYRLRQILINLINNALKFTDKGQIEVVVAQNTGNWLHIEVRDTGRGINTSKISQIFEEYVQVESNDWLKSKGTGLGLAITKKIVEAMNGKISVESKLDQGSIFTVRLPFGIPEKKENQKLVIGKTIEKIDLSLKSILVVEDDAFSGLLIHTILSNNGANVTLVSDGETAVSKIHNEIFDLIITDMQVPKISGEEIVAIIKNHNIQTPVLVVSANPQFLEYTVPTFLKPFKEGDFIAKIGEILEIESSMPEEDDSQQNILEADQKRFIEYYIKALENALESGNPKSKAVHDVNHNLIPFLIYIEHEELVPQLKQLETMLELDADINKINAAVMKTFADLRALCA